jgi:hypothetical protein
VQHCCDDQFDVVLVDSGQGVAKADWYPAGQARRQPQHPLFPAAAGQVAGVEGGAPIQLTVLLRADLGP